MMRRIKALREWWRQFWAKKLGWPSDHFQEAFDDLKVRLLVIEKRCEALTPGAWLYRRDE